MDTRSRTFVSALLIVIVCHAVANAQEKPRILDFQRYKYKNEPIDVVNQQVEGKSFTRDDQIMGQSKWLRELKLGIRNVSAKNITYVEIHLVIGAPNKRPVHDSIVIRFTGWPTFGDNSDYAKRGGRRAVLKPGDIAFLFVKEQLGENISNYLEKLEDEDFNRVSVDIRYVHFDDGTGWAVGHETRQDPSNPGSFVPIRDKPNPISQNQKGKPKRLAFQRKNQT